MFVWSVKTSRRQLWWLLGCLAGAAVLITAAVLWPAGSSATAATMNDRASRIAYLQALGYVVDADSEEVSEVRIPDTFDEPFSGYNDLQKQAGMDLTPYRGKRVKCWCYRVLNLPGREEATVHLYVYRDRVVGGDVSAAIPGGMAVGLIPLEEIPLTTEGETDGETG